MYFCLWSGTYDVDHEADLQAQQIVRVREHGCVRANTEANLQAQLSVKV